MSAVVSSRVLGTALVLVGVGLAVSAEVVGHERTVRGREQTIGGGTMQSFVTLDPKGAPLAIGITLSAGALERLPPEPNTVSRCFDLDGNGVHTGHECMGDEERILELPTDASAKLPFSWMMINWNPAGHHNTPYARPHFDFHFYLTDRSRVENIAPGRCGEMVNCEDFRRGSQPVPARYLPADYIDVGAVAPRMGNHLLDSRSPELKDSLRFTSTFIFGAYEGDVIFWEPMITLDFLRAARNACLEIRQPQAFQRTGYYPTQYCVRQNGVGRRTVSLERFRYADAL
jgi:hypothetical protein